MRRTGGLDDSVIDASDDSALANGIKFTEYSSHALSRAIRKALHVYNDPKLLAHYRRAGMTADFSWDSVVGQYLDCYDLAGRH